MSFPDMRIRVMVVDDSVIFRRFLSRALSKDPNIEVVAELGTAEEAIQFLKNAKPDVITLDLEMPGLGGLSFLKETVQRYFVPTVVISSRTQNGAQVTIDALRSGAVDALAKPRGIAPGTPDHIALAEFVTRIKAAARARVDVPKGKPKVDHAERSQSFPPDWILAIGSSTGGVHALGVVLEALPPNCPPLVIVQHMPEGFTDAFARRLNSACEIEVKEAVEGDRLRPGLALIAPGGDRHMHVERARDGHYVVRLVDGPPVSFSRPSVDELFMSLALVAAPRVSAVVLTGMGSDGANGLLALRAGGSQTFAQDKASSVIYGMPARAWENGAAMEQVPLDEVPAKLLASIGTASAFRATAQTIGLR